MSINRTGTCPVCTGTLRTPVPGELGDDPTAVVGYDSASRTIPCRNCGNPYISQAPTGTVPLRPDGTPCTHEYRQVFDDHEGGTSTYIYSCGRCGAEYICRTYG